MPTTYWCGIDCPENPSAWELHEAFDKKVREQRKAWEDGGEVQRLNHETAEREARRAAQSGNVRCADGRRRAVRLQGGLAQTSQGQPRGYRPESRAYYGLGAVLANSGHNVEAARSGSSRPWSALVWCGLGCPVPGFFFLPLRILSFIFIYFPSHALDFSHIFLLNI